MSPYIANDVNSKREEIFEKIKKAFEDNLGKKEDKLVSIFGLNLSNLDFPDAMDKANAERAAQAILKDKAIAEQEKVKAEIETAKLDIIKKEVADYTQELLSKHIGDCTCVPCSCTKCRAESMLEIDTIRGLGKHSSYKIDSAFSGGASIDEAIHRLENYQPTYDPNSKWPRSDWEQHVPRWIEEGKRAHAWLVAYRDEHFVKVDHEQR